MVTVAHSVFLGGRGGFDGLSALQDVVLPAYSADCSDCMPVCSHAQYIDLRMIGRAKYVPSPPMILPECLKLHV
jgi:hypothetical protein